MLSPLPEGEGTLFGGPDQNGIRSKAYYELLWTIVFRCTLRE